jgi:hypothetical protein
LKDVPQGTPYKGPSGIARESTWLTNEDLPHDRDTPVQIEAVLRRNNLTMEGGREKKVALSLRFVGRQRELLLNATNRKMLTALFDSTDTGKWFGQWVALFVEQGVRKPDGTKGPAVRIRAKRIQPPTKGAPQPEPESTGGDLPDYPDDLKEVMQ